MIYCENIIKYCGRCICHSQKPLPYLQGRFKSPCPRHSGFRNGMATLTCINKHGIITVNPPEVWSVCTLPTLV